jgi:hypothetical protein
MRAGLSHGSNRGHVTAAGSELPGCRLSLSADAVAAEVASRAEKLRVRLAAASTQVQEAAAAAAAGPEGPGDAAAAAASGDEQEDAASSARDTLKTYSGDDDEAACASVQQQVNISPAGALPVLQSETSEFAGTSLAGSDSSMDSDLERLVQTCCTAGLDKRQSTSTH